MTNQLVKPENDFDLALAQVDSIGKLASMLMKTKHYGKLGEEGIFAILFAAKSVGVDPFQALNSGFNYIQGRVSMSTELMAAMIRKHGHSITLDPKSNDEICILHGKRRDSGDTWTTSFSVEDARKADLLKNIYNKYRSVMLYNRAMSKMARQLFPDVIKGNGYSEDELEEIYENDKKNSIPVKPIDTTSKENLPVEKSYVEMATEENIKTMNCLVEKYPTDIKDKFEELKKKNMDRYGNITATFCHIQINAALKYISENPQHQDVK